MGSSPARCASRCRRLAVVVLGAVIPLAVALGGCSGGTAGGTPGGPAGSTPAAVGVAARRVCTVRAVAMLDRWDRARAAAYAEDDARALRRLYVPGARARARDVRVLRQYAARGLVVTGLRRQLVAVHIVGGCGPRRLRLEVRDRLLPARVRGAGGPRRLPGSSVHRWSLVFERTDRGWLLAGVARV